MAYTKKKRKQLKRVRQFIARAEKRGYRFGAEFKEQLTELSTQKLKNLTPQKLYEKAQAISQETGKVVTGSERRIEERKESALKGQETRRRHKAEKEQIEYYKFADRTFSEYETSYEQTILLNIEARIREYENHENPQFSGGANMLRDFLDEQIALYGRKFVALQIEGAPDRSKELADGVIFGSEGSTAHVKSDCLMELLTIITGGEVPTLAQSIQMGKTMEAQENYDEPL